VGESFLLNLDFRVTVGNDVSDLHRPDLLHQGSLDVVFFVLVAELVQEFPVFVYLLELFLQSNLSDITGNFDKLPD
jgi:hypothetical protein